MAHTFSDPDGGDREATVSSCSQRGHVHSHRDGCRLITHNQELPIASSGVFETILMANRIERAPPAAAGRKRRRTVGSPLILISSFLLLQVAAHSQSEWVTIPRGGELVPDGENATSAEQRPKLWPLGHLFQWNNDVKADVEEEEVRIPSDRGGALVKQRRFQQFLAPFDTSKVAPFASRLLRAEDAVVKKAVVAVEDESKESSKAWWVNAWSEQIPTEEDEASFEAQALVVADPVSDHASEEEEGWIEPTEELKAIEPVIDAPTVEEPEERPLERKHKKKVKRKKVEAKDPNEEPVTTKLLLPPTMQIPEEPPVEREDSSDDFVSSGAVCVH